MVEYELRKNDKNEWALFMLDGLDSQMEPITEWHSAKWWGENHSLQFTE